MKKWNMTQKLIIIGLIGYIVCPTVSASPLMLTLKDIQKTKTSESSGDELYFSVTEYSSAEDPKTTFLPQPPMHWVSGSLSQVKNVVLWKRELKKGEAVELVLSLTEHDTPPWDLDDVIGTIKVKFKQEGDDLVSEWRALAPKATQSKPYGSKEYIFDLEGDNSSYLMTMHLAYQ